MKNILLILTTVLISISILGCSNSESKESATSATAPIATTPTAIAPTATAPKILTPKVSAKIDYTILEEFKVFKQDKGYGALILISPSAKKDDIIDLIRKISGNSDPVAVEVFTSQKAYEEYKSLKTTDEFRKGYVASYTKNKTLEGQPFYGENRIVWTQEIGDLSSLKFTSTNLD